MIRMKRKVIIMAPELREVVELHRSVYPALGEIVEVFTKDGRQCVRYSNGEWYHYNAERQTWW